MAKKSFRETNGYSRINLLSRKEKDTRALAQAEKNGGGTVRLKSNKISKPLGDNSYSTQLKRKQVVKVTPGAERKIGEKTEMVSPEKTEVIPGKTTTKFKSADFNNGKINLRRTTSETEFGRSKEMTGKKSTRQSIQEAGEKGEDYSKAGGYDKDDKVVYKNHKGQEELAGIKETTKEPDEIRKTPAQYKTTPITEKRTRFDAKMPAPEGDPSGRRKYNLKFKDNGGVGTPEKKYYKTTARKKMMRGKGY